MTANRLEYKKFQIKPRSHEFYSTYIRLYLVPQIRTKKLDKLTTPDVRHLLLEVKATVSADAANKTLIVIVLSGALKQAMRDGLIPRNPAEPVAPFKVDGKLNDHSWEISETLRFIETARPHRLLTAFYLANRDRDASWRGLGLRWSDVEGDTIYVRQSLIIVNHAYALSTLKTQRGIRRVVIDPETLAVLETCCYSQLEEKRNAGEGWCTPSPEYDDLIFTVELGGPIHPRNFDGLLVRPFGRGQGLEDLLLRLASHEHFALA